MKAISTFVSLLIIQFGLFAQNITPQLLGFDEYQIDSKKYGEINYYISSDTTSHPKPLLVYLDGSGADPLFQKMESGIASTVVIDFQHLQTEYRILFISKPGIPFYGERASSPNPGSSIPHEPLDYTERLSRDWRVGSANLIIDRLVKEKSIDTSRIVVLGFSEGAQVAPKLACENEHVTHLMMFGGNGLNQLFDPIITTRMKASKGTLSEIEAQHQIDSLLLIYKDIYANPTSTSDRWWGHTYKRWASFSTTDPYQELLTLDIPIYIANGS
ncbi:MAG: hypothetical protein AAFR14_12720, partial [Bacteroidota bacterium]